MSEQNKKTALITGANRGIGYETARQLGQQGIKVLIGARTEENGREAESKLKKEGFDAEFILLDVDDAKTHESAAKHVEENYGKLDILINNAGIMIDEYENNSPIGASQTSSEVWRKTFDTNFFNTIALTQRFVPLIKKSDAGRIVFLSSGLGSLNLHSDPNSPIYDFKVSAQRPELADLRFQSSGLRHLENRAQRLRRASGLRIKRHAD